MKHALIAASLVLVAGLGAGCGGGDDPEPETSETSAVANPTSTTEEFCEAYTSLAKEFQAGTQPTDAQAVQAIKKWADELDEVGPPEDIPADARKGYELIVETVQKIEEDATQEDIEKLTEAFTKAEQESPRTRSGSGPRRPARCDPPARRRTTRAPPRRRGRRRDRGRGRADRPSAPTGQTTCGGRSESADHRPPGVGPLDHPAVEVDGVDALLDEVADGLAERPPILQTTSDLAAGHLVEPLRQLHQRDVDRALDVAVRPLDRLAHVEHRHRVGERVGDAVDGHGRDLVHGASRVGCHLSSLDSRRSASGLPPVWQVAQY